MGGVFPRRYPLVRTCEKPSSACDSRVALLRSVQALSAILSRLCFCSVSCLFSPWYGSFRVSIACMIDGILRATEFEQSLGVGWHLPPKFCMLGELGGEKHELEK